MNAELMKAAFEAKYQRDWDDPASAEMKAIWADAWAESWRTAEAPKRYVLGEEVAVKGKVMGCIVWHDGEQPGGGKPQLYQHYEDAEKHAADYLPGTTQITPIVKPAKKL